MFCFLSLFQRFTSLGSVSRLCTASRFTSDLFSSMINWHWTNQKSPLGLKINSWSRLLCIGDVFALLLLSVVLIWPALRLWSVSPRCSLLAAGVPCASSVSDLPFLINYLYKGTEVHVSCVPEDMAHTLTHTPAPILGTMRWRCDIPSAAAIASVEIFNHSSDTKAWLYSIDTSLLNYVLTLK